MLTRAGVLGDPVAHSLSPALHEAAYAATGLASWRYQLLPVPRELFAETVRALPELGFAGANVTIPHKEAALAIADDASDAARAIGAANTLTFRDGAIAAENTDAPGLIDALPQSPAGRAALVLGAGGSARAVVWALLRAGARDVMVLSRTQHRAAELCAALGGRVVSRAQPAELLVNCTPIGLAPDDELAALGLAPRDVAARECVVDLAYSRSPTPIVAAAREAGVPAVTGLDVLIAQGVRSFRIWTGIAPPLEPIRAALGAVVAHDS